METLLPLLIQVLGGGAGGNLAGKLLKNIDLSKIVQTVLGIVGGVLGGQGLGALEILQSVLGSEGAGGLLGNAGASGISGAVLVAVIGLIKKMMSPANNAE